jgi:glycosyltransferase involved in cell wall biosynthesis
MGELPHEERHNMVTISIASLIYRSKKYADWLYNSVYEFTPLLKRGEAEFFFVANDPTEELLEHLRQKGYQHYVNVNPKRTEEELFRMGYGAPEYIHRVYRGFNKAIGTAAGDIVVLVNSDHYFSPDWLENLLKYLSSRTIVSSKIVERRHPDHGIFPGAYHGEFGSHPDNFDKQGFLAFCERKKTTGLQLGGAYMPCAFYKRLAIQVGLYPEGNIAGTTFNDVVSYGDERFFSKLAEAGVSHVTAMDSIVYHLKEGEMDEPSSPPTMFTDRELQKDDKEEPEFSRGEAVLPVILGTDGEREYLAGDLPLVSIITPAYNRASYLDETIQSVLAQDYPNIEYIVLNDGSTDNTREVLKKYTGRLIWETHSNMGETKTVNKGWSMAHGEIVAVANSDDPLLPRAVSSAVAFLQTHPDILVAYPDWDFIDPDSNVTGHHQVPEYDYLYMLRRHHCSVGPGAFIRRQAFELAGMRDPEFRYVADFEYWLRLGLYGKFARIPKTLATFRVHPDSASVSHRGQAMAQEHIQLVRKLYSRPDLPPEVLRVRSEAFSWAHWVAGVVAGLDLWVALRHYLRAMTYHPRSFFTDLYRWQAVLSVVLPKPLFKVLQWGWHRIRPILARGHRILKGKPAEA